MSQLLQRSLIVFLLVFGGQACSILQKNNEYDIALNVKKKTLENGLTILVVENKKLPIFSYYTYFKVGSKFEAPGITGSSHLLEHMMFKGAKKYGAGEFDKLVEGNGGKNNAYTSNDLTVYYESLPSEHFDVIADLEADRMQNLLLEKESFEKERNVVLEERKLRYENRDSGKLYLTMMKTAFKGTPYGSSVIGEIEDLKTVSRKEVLDYFKKYYAPNNAVVIVVGDVDAKHVFKKMQEKFGDIKPTKNLDKLKQKHLSELGFDFRKDFEKTIHLKGTGPVPQFMLAFQGKKVGHKDAFTLDILASILGEGKSSYLTEKFVIAKNPQLSSIQAANYTLQESGIFFLMGELLPERKLNSFIKDLKKELSQSCENAITERSLQKVLNQYLVGMFSGLDTNAGIASFLGDREVYYGDYNFYKKEIDMYRSISVDQLKAACQQYINNKESVLITVWNKN